MRFRKKYFTYSHNRKKHALSLLKICYSMEYFTTFVCAKDITQSYIKKKNRSIFAQITLHKNEKSDIIIDYIISMGAVDIINKMLVTHT